jgi:hypothetical protein
MQYASIHITGDVMPSPGIRRTVPADGKVLEKENCLRIFQHDAIVDAALNLKATQESRQRPQSAPFGTFKLESCEEGQPGSQDTVPSHCTGCQRQRMLVRPSYP